MLEKAVEFVIKSDILIIIGSSMQVYPAASLAGFAPPQAEMHYIDPRPSLNFELSLRPQLNIIAEPATIGVPKLVDTLIQKHERVH